MKRQTLLLTSLCLLSQPVLADRIIDDFKTGRIQNLKHKCGIQDQASRARVPGSFRWVRLQINKPPKCEKGNPRSQSTSAEIRSGRLIVNNGFRVRSRTEIHYGRDHKGNKYPMNLDTTERSRRQGYLELSFSGSASGLNLNIVLGANGGKRASCGYNIPAKPRGFSIAFPLNKLRRVNGMRLADFKDIDYMDVIIQTAEGNFGLQQIKVTKKPRPSSIRVSRC